MYVKKMQIIYSTPHHCMIHDHPFCASINQSPITRTKILAKKD